MNKHCVEDTGVSGHTSSAYVLAMANMHKPWARRWMDANGYRWAASIYRERQRKARTHVTDEPVSKQP